MMNAILESIKNSRKLIADLLLKMAIAIYIEKMGWDALINELDVEEKNVVFSICIDGAPDFEYSKRTYNSLAEEYFNLIDDSLKIIAKEISLTPDCRETIENHIVAVTATDFYKTVGEAWQLDAEKERIHFLKYFFTLLSKNDKRLFFKCRKRAEKISERLIVTEDIIAKDYYMIYNKWYDKDWYKLVTQDSNRLSTNFQVSCKTGNSKGFIDLEREITDKNRICFYTASREVYKMMFSSEKINDCKDDIIGKYIAEFKPTNKDYAYMLSETIPTLFPYSHTSESYDDKVNSVLSNVEKGKIGGQKVINKNGNINFQEQLNLYFYKALMYPINDLAYIPGKKTATYFKRWLKRFNISGVDELIDLAPEKYSCKFRDHVFLIPKVLTVQLRFYIQRDGKKMRSSVIQQKKYANAAKKKEEISDLMFDIIIFDEQLLSSIKGNPAFANKASGYIKANKNNERLNIYIEKVEKKADDKIKKYECAIKAIQARNTEPDEDNQCRGGRMRKSKTDIDTRCKRNREKENCEFFKKYSVELIKKRWKDNNNLRVTHKDIEDSLERIKKCILLTAFFISKDAETYHKFVEEHAELK